MANRVYSVSQINRYLKDVIDAEELLSHIEISGEVSGFGISGKHAYFTLKDEAAQISCAFFGYHCDFRVTDGMRVVATGTPRFYVKGGRLNFQVTRLKEQGEGDAYRRFLELKEKLGAEGLFDRHRPLPAVIRRIGVVTSPTGAVIHDIINVATRRDPNVDIVLYPVKVQGIGAEMEIADGIRRMDAYHGIDVIIVARGGGSAEDLMPFNDEIVARAVASCGKVIVSSVGHETDVTLCDFCADLRAPTPSAAAELVTQDHREKKLAVGRCIQSIADLAERKLVRAFDEIESILSSLRAEGVERISQAQSAVYKRLYTMRDRLQRLVWDKETALKELARTLEWRNPLKVLTEGYAAVVCDGVRVTGVDQVGIGQEIKILLQDGELDASVVSKKEIRYGKKDRE